MELAPKIAFPRFIVLEANDKLNYLSYIRGGDTDGYLRFFEDRIQSPFAKFEVEFSTNDLVHIRSCQNNKYWERPSNPHYITATADNKEEDQSKESCTLFRILFVNAADQNRVRIQHVQSGCYLCLWYSNNPALYRCVLAKYTVFDHQDADIFTVIDWSSLLFLPRYLAFKGDNNQFLCVRYVNNGSNPFLQFTTGDIGDPTVPFEVFPTNDGNIRFKQISNQNYWRRSPDWIWADSNDTSTNNRDTLFRAVKVDDQTIGLINLGNNHFCKRLTAENNRDCLNAQLTTLTKEAHLKVEEAVLTREIYGVKYDLDKSRVYDETILSLDERTSVNETQQSSTLDVPLSYEDTRTSSWNTDLSLMLGLASTMEFKIPLIYDGKIELSGQFESSIEWGNVTTVTALVETVHKVTVPPMTEAAVTAMGTYGKCDVPFTFLQRDTLFDGRTVLSEVQGGVFTGANYYSVNFVTRNKKLEQEQ
ncbi:hypothetical protein F3Y22_tig00110258pilonHSYRG00104 [Hibiscus syriacus]|uniref:Agglutinin domain-containing protein n=1 Tax=Hibiscus syriacus TaxID=106335 RepID=A0A6A3B7L0_HIBSY|nr:hypothetical protein F3Y22_tig00110258pilonHSYRG00104 [Hibiscus syriacus]